MKRYFLSLSILVSLTASPSITAFAEEAPLAQAQKVEAKTAEAKAVEAAPTTTAEAPVNVQQLLDRMDESIKKENVLTVPTSKLEEGLLSKEELKSDAKGSPNLLSQAKNEESVPWLKTGLSTVFVCSLIVLVSWVVNQKSKGAKVFSVGQSKDQSLRVLQKLNLGLKSELVLIEVENERLLLSVQASQIQVLHQIQNRKKEEANEKPQLNAQNERQVREMQLLEELNLAKGQLHKNATPVEAKDKLSSRIRQVVQRLTPLSKEENLTVQETGSEKKISALA